MLFPTTVFAVFFAVVYALHWSLPERSLARKVVLLAASVFFYCWWRCDFAAMMLASAALNHFLAKRIDAAPVPRRKKTLLVVAVTINLAALAFFKYTGFIFTQIALPLAVPICNAFGATDALLDFNERALPFVQSIVLPVGISFYTFQAVSYVADVAWGKCRPAASYLDFANYLSFFPKLAAGPIARPGDLLPQMEALPARTLPIDTGRATTLVLGGLLKKMVVANWLAGHLADPFFQFPEDYGTFDAFLGCYGYAIQIYCDFSAYSDIATGCALLLGFKFPENFRAPYIATSFQDFWRRWHISLSSWLRDYLYIPMGGSRCAKWKIHRNLVMTMLLGGPWHGAGWTYILWGAIHGVAQVIERPFNKKRPKDAPPENRAVKFLRGLVTFHVVVFAWIFFRAGASDAEGLATVRGVFSAFTNTGEPAKLFSVTALVLLASGFALQLLDGETPRKVWAAFSRLNPCLRALIAAILLAIVLGLGPSGVAPFIYFQF